MLWGRRSSVQHSGGRRAAAMPWGTVLPARCCSGHPAVLPVAGALPGSHPCLEEKIALSRLLWVWALWDEPGSVHLKVTVGCLAPTAALPALIRGLGHKPFVGILGCKCTNRGLGVILGDKPNVLGPRRAQHPPTFADKTAVNVVHGVQLSPLHPHPPPCAGSTSHSCRGDKQPPQPGPPQQHPQQLALQNEGRLGLFQRTAGALPARQRLPPPGAPP